MLQSLLAETLQCTANDHVLILNSAADPCLSRLAQQLDNGELLLAEDNIAAAGHAQKTIKRSGAQGLHVRQVAFHEYALREMPATMDVAVLNILYQPGNAWMHYALQLAAYALKPGGRLYIEGAKDRGILSIGKRAQELFGNLETLEISKGQRVIRSLKREQTKTTLAPATLAPFAAGKIDEGTSLLLEHIEVNVSDIALDLGCGAGFIGAQLAARASKGQVTLIDTSLVGIAAAQQLLTERGLNNAQVLASDGVQAVQERRFDLIATNPPFHIGGIQTTAIAERFIREAATVARPRGRFYVVANRFLKYETPLRTWFSTVEEVGGNSRFKVLRATGAQKKPIKPDETDDKETIIFQIQ